MSIKVIEWVFRHSASRNGERLVLLAIADNASTDGTGAYPSIAELSRKTALSERAVQNAIRGLVRLGELSVEDQSGPGLRNLYTVNMNVADCTPAESAPPQDLRDVADCTPADFDVRPPQNATETPADFDEPPTPPNKEEPSREPSVEPSLLLDPTSSESNGQLVLADPSQPTPAPPKRINGHEFDQFWSIYPRRVGKAKAREAFKRACRRASLETILTGARQLQQLHETGQQSMRYMPHPTTWLNRDGWADDPEHVAPGERSTTDNRVQGFLDIANSYLQGEATHAEVGNGSPARHDQRL